MPTHEYLGNGYTAVRENPAPKPESVVVLIDNILQANLDKESRRILLEKRRVFANPPKTFLEKVLRTARSIFP